MNRYDFIYVFVRVNERERAPAQLCHLPHQVLVRSTSNGK